MNFSLIVCQVEKGESRLLRQAPAMIAFVEQQQEAEALVECQAQADAVAAYLANQADVAEFNAAVLVSARQASAR